MSELEEYKAQVDAANLVAHRIIKAAILAIEDLGFRVDIWHLYNFEEARMKTHIQTRMNRATYTELERLRDKESQA